ncbi:hypothetical protein [Algoriphagus persicinus]|uniref:hypothetical protein n=1 Tax=Algoriphagus persicinus TaxID=3108754 RepID=UPI002B391E0F|nr:hypothetical protein [Algoriphagus sp. E1-3-M2]MEB2783086.1 hypothetical protein [Algoriphagus sp. E1-3-M2]
MKKKVRKQQEQDNENEPVVVLVEDKESTKEDKQEIKMTPVEEEQEPMTPLAAASPMKTESKK